MSPATLDATFAALADPTRRAILARLREGDASVAELAEPFSISQPAISRHLKVLQNAGLISRRRVAQTRPCHIEGKSLADVTRWLDAYRDLWEQNFARLDEVLRQMAPAKAAAGASEQRPRSRRRRRGK